LQMAEVQSPDCSSVVLAHIQVADYLAEPQ
jgi:hypothetical protein